MKRTTKKFLTIMMGVIGVFILVGIFIFQNFSYIDTKYPTTIACNKQTGCTAANVQTCNNEISTFLKTNINTGWICSNDCYVECSNTAEMKALDYSYNIHCDSFYGGGAIVQATSKCTLTTPQSHAKTICSDGSKTVFSSGISATQKDFIGWDIYYANEFDQLEEKKTDCSYGCKMTTDTKAECYTEETYNKCENKVCYAVSNRWNIMCKDSDGEYTSIQETCQAGCTAGKCNAVTTVPPTTPPTTCSFAACENDMTTKCNDGTSITTYKCENKCAVPTTEMCDDSTSGDGTTTSSCKLYEQQNADATCSFSIGNFLTSDGLKAYYQDNTTTVLVGIAIFFILMAILIWRIRS